MWSNQRNVTLDISPPVKLSTLPFGSICGLSDEWTQRTSTWTRARCWCVRLLRVTSFTRSTICFMTRPSRRSACVDLQGSRATGAVMGPSSEWKKVFGSPARRVGQSPQMCGSCYQVGRVRADLFFWCSVDLRGLLLLQARLVPVKPLCLRVWPRAFPFSAALLVLGFGCLDH